MRWGWGETHPYKKCCQIRLTAECLFWTFMYIFNSFFGIDVVVQPPPPLFAPWNFGIIIFLCFTLLTLKISSNVFKLTGKHLFLKRNSWKIPFLFKSRSYFIEKSFLYSMIIEEFSSKFTVSYFWIKPWLKEKFSLKFLKKIDCSLRRILYYPSNYFLFHPHVLFFFFVFF